VSLRDTFADHVTSWLYFLTCHDVEGKAVYLYVIFKLYSAYPSSDTNPQESSSYTPPLALCQAHNKLSILSNLTSPSLIRTAALDQAKEVCLLLPKIKESLAYGSHTSESLIFASDFLAIFPLGLQHLGMGLNHIGSLQDLRDPMVRLMSRYWSDIEGWLSDCASGFASLPSTPNVLPSELLATAKSTFYLRTKKFLLLLYPLISLHSALLNLSPTFGYLFLAIWKVSPLIDEDESHLDIEEDDMHLFSTFFTLTQDPSFSPVKASFIQIREDASPDGVMLVTKALKKICLFSSEKGNISCNMAVITDLLLDTRNPDLLQSFLHEGLFPLCVRICYRYLSSIASFTERERGQLWVFTHAVFMGLHKLIGFDAVTLIPAAGCGKVIIKLIWRALVLDMLYCLPSHVMESVIVFIDTVTECSMYYSTQRHIESTVSRYSKRSTEGLAKSLEEKWRFLCLNVVDVGIPLRKRFLAEKHDLCWNYKVSSDSSIEALNSSPMPFAL
jgi:hypothetical protein